MTHRGLPSARTYLALRLRQLTMPNGSSRCRSFHPRPDRTFWRIPELNIKVTSVYQLVSPDSSYWLAPEARQLMILPYPAHDVI